MKEIKKQEDQNSRAAAIRQAFLDRARATGNARSLLSQLETWLSGHERELRTTELRTSRLNLNVRRVISNGTVRCLVADPTVPAAQLIGGRDLSEILLEQERDPALQRFYGSISLTGGERDMVTDPGDLDLFKTWNRERAACVVLKAAIGLQKKAMLAINAASMKKFSATVVQARAATARQVLVALGELRRIVEPDQDLTTGLDQDEIAALSPQPFPARILSSDAMSWMMDAVAAGMIKATELADLQPEIVAPTAQAEEEGESQVRYQI